MPEITRITYSGNGESVKADKLGMRLMQRKIYDRRNEQYLLLKSPPASGKSRACMYVALDKMYYQHLKKTIIAVPERTIAASFKSTNLTDGGFFIDWEPDPEYNLCGAGTDSGKIKKFEEFFSNPSAKIMLCTHATLRLAFNKINNPAIFNNCFLAIDEFHHTSADTESSRLGDLVKTVIENSTAHILAMTGSYFRGDGVAVLEPEVEAKFTTVTFSYYDQLSGYKYLKAITLSYDFYQGMYFDMLAKDLDTTKKSIIHIPNVNSAASTKMKYNEVDQIIGLIGDVVNDDLDTGICHVKTADGRILKVIDLVDDTPSLRMARQQYLHDHANEKDAVDIIIALNLAKEGFDWPPCEHMLTVGYRGSLTEIVQIIGRCTRDYPGKVEARFTNIIAEPDADSADVVEAVNNLLKAITASLLMVQVLIPKWSFKDKLPKLQILEPKSKEGKDILENDLDDLIQSIQTDDEVIKAIPKKNAGKLINKMLIPKIIVTKYPDLPNEDVEAIRQAVVTNLVAGNLLYNEEQKKKNDEESGKSNASAASRLLHFADGLALDIRELSINMIDEINPFEDSYQILAKTIDKQTLGKIQAVINEKKGRSVSFSEAELKVYTPQAVSFVNEYNRLPDRYSDNPYEAKLGEVLWFIKKQRAAEDEADGE